MVPLQAVGLMVLKLLMMITFFMALRLQRTPAEATPSPQGGPCRASCGSIPINYPFGVEDGCGAPQFRHMFNCRSTESDLFFVTPSGSYKVESIDYQKKTVEIYDPAMSTCSILQPHHDFIMTEVQSAIIPPTPDTVFALLNCSIDSPVLNHYKYLCFDFSDHSCDELYGACNAFRVFHDLPISSSSSSSSTNFTGPAPSGPPAPPPCCFTGYDTLRYMSMNILDCTHYTSVLNTDKLKGIPPLDWVYGIKLSYSIPETGCDRCSQSGGACGYDTQTAEGIFTCLCSTSTNATRQCAAGSITASGDHGSSNPPLWTLFLTFLMPFISGAYQ